jgi:hypothetical protein
MMLAALFDAVLATTLPVQVESASCPSGREVEQALASMLPSLSGTIRPEVAHIQRRGNQLQIELVGADAALSPSGGSTTPVPASTSPS